MACGRPSETPPRDGVQATPTEIGWFTEQALQAGLDFVHMNGMTGRYYEAEIYGPGVALLDYDADGDLDVYLTQGGALEPGAKVSASGGRLFRNDLRLAAGTPVVQFADVTDAAGIAAREYGMGVAVGDFDRDGFPDLYLANLGPNQLLRNTGKGTFTDVSARSGTADPSWSVSAAFVDIDRDGWLDLYVANYLKYSIDADVPCFGVAGRPDYCDPREYRPETDRLYRNRGDGTFADVTATALRNARFGAALGVVTGDFNGDGWRDLYVANDGRENLLWINQRDGTFADTALLAGVAVNGAGRPEAGMGVDAADFDNDGDDDLFVTNWRGETNTYYVNDGSGLFEDRTAQAGLGPASLPMTGFGTGAVDVDNDGLLDIVVVNGGVIAHEAQALEGDPLPLREPKQAFRNLGNGRFEDASSRAGAFFETLEVGRGAAFGDVDNDGDVDMLVGNNNGPARLLLNQVSRRTHWIGMRLVEGEPATDAIGAGVAVTLPDGSVVWRSVHGDGSYASASDLRVLVGLGDTSDIRGVEVRWPDGTQERWGALSIDRWHLLKRGSAP